MGDDILVTNPVRVKKAIECKAVNALLLKVNQIGTITESIEAVRMSKEAGWGVMCSHRCACASMGCMHALACRDSGFMERYMHARVCGRAGAAAHTTHYM